MFFVNRDWMECPIFHLNYLSHLCRVWIRSWGKGYQGRLSTPSLWREILSRERSKGQGLLRKVNHVSHLCEEKWLVEATVVLKKTEHFSRKTFSCQQKSVYNSMRGWVSPIFTNAFLEQIKNNMQNLSNTKVFKVTKGCLKNLARAKNKMRAQKK